MENLYSTYNYQNICPQKNSKPIKFNIFDSSELQNIINGVLIGKNLSFGIFAPFWFPNFLEKTSDLDKLDKYLNEIIKLSIKLKVKSIAIKLPPEFYSNNIASFIYLLEVKKFKQTSLTLWQCLDLKNIKNKDDYIKFLPYSSKKILKKFNEKDFEMKLVNLLDNKKIKDSYDLINRNRNRKGNKLKYSFEYLKKIIFHEKEKITIFDLYYKNKIVASAICHLTYKNTLYVANWGDNVHNLKYSVMYNFCLELIKYCIQKKIYILDFGISTDLKNQNHSLFSFKKKIGCKSFVQKTYKISLS